MRCLILVLGFLPILVHAANFVQDSPSVVFLKNKCANEKDFQLRQKYCDFVQKQKKAEAILNRR